MEKRINSLLIFMLVVASCIDHDNSSQQVRPGEIKQTVLQDIRTDTTNSWSHFHNVRQLARQLKLNPVENGFDSLQIRIWFDHSLAYHKQLIILEQRKKSWRGWHYEIKVRYVDTLNYNIIEGYTKKEIEPQSGWENLISSLEQLKFRELSDTSQRGTDGMTYCVEVLNRESYTYYDFWAPEYSIKSNWKANNMVEIIGLLEKEFRFNRSVSR